MKLTQDMNLSKTMIETISAMRVHGNLKRYEGGFWSWEETELEPLYNSGKLLCMIPVWHCDVKTLRALAKKGLVTLNESEKVCILN